MATHPGVYCLRTNSELAWDEEKLWRTYQMLVHMPGECVSRIQARLGATSTTKEVMRSDGHLFDMTAAYFVNKFLVTSRPRE